MRSLHKWFILFLLIILPLFILRESRLLLDKKGVSYVVDEDFYMLNPHNPDDKTFVIMLITDNVNSSIVATLHSIFAQKYEKYRVVLIDGGSSDGTYKTALKCVQECGKEDKIELIARENGNQVFETYYNVALECSDRDIIVHLPGADFLVGSDVLSHLNAVYKNQDVWLTYPQYISYPSYVKGLKDPRPSKPQVKRKIERAPWVLSPLRTYYASLIKQVHIDRPDTILSVEGEKSLMLPMAEMAKCHVRFIPEVFYVHTEGKHQLKLSYLGKVQLIYIGNAKDLTFPLPGIDKVTCISNRSELKDALVCDYVLIADNPSELKAALDIKKSLLALQVTKAHAFVFTPKALKDAAYFGNQLYTNKLEGPLPQGLYRHEALLEWLDTKQAPTCCFSP